MPYHYFSLDEMLGIPYTIAVQATQDSDGSWVCEASHPELPNCVARDRNVITALERLDEARVNYLTACHIAGEPAISPRPTLTPGSERAHGVVM